VNALLLAFGGHAELEDFILCAVLALIIGLIAYLIAGLVAPGIKNIIGVIFFLLALVLCIL
jgi:uncharacterized membrane protein YhaH (DUF805 family)